MKTNKRATVLIVDAFLQRIPEMTDVLKQFADMGEVIEFPRDFIRQRWQSHIIPPIKVVPVSAKQQMALRLFST